MSFITGKYDCKVDSKGRFIFPAALKKQLPENESDAFTIVRGEKEGQFILYTQKAFEEKMEELERLDEYTEQNEDYKILFYDSVQTMSLDSAMRLNLPDRHIQEAGINKDIVLLGMGKKIALWAAEKYPQANSGKQAELKKQLVWDKLDKKKNT